MHILLSSPWNFLQSKHILDIWQILTNTKNWNSF
jgi:hypothetical protein